MAKRLLILSYLLASVVLSFTLDASDGASTKKSYAWRGLEEDLEIKKLFSNFANSLEEDKSANPSAISLRCRQILNRCAQQLPSSDPEISQLVVASLAFAGQNNAIELMSHVLDLRGGYPVVSWLCAMQYLSNQPDPKACEILTRCLGMPYLEINMAAAYFLSQNPYAHSDPATIDRLLSLQRRLPREVWIWVVQLLASFDTPASSKVIQQIYYESEPSVQGSILQLLAENNTPFDDLAAHAMATSSPVLQEAALYYTLLHPSSQAPWFQTALSMTQSRYERVSIMANVLKIYYTQDEKAEIQLKQHIQFGNLHAIAGAGLLARLNPSGLQESLQNALLNQLKTSQDSRVCLNAMMSLLDAMNPACLDALGDVFNDSTVLLSISTMNSSSWPTYLLQALPDPKDSSFQYAVTQQYQSRRWLLEKANRLPINQLQNWYTQIISSDEGASHYLIATQLSHIASPKAVEILQSWKEMPAKPWLRLGSAVSLWRINREQDSLEKLQNWMGQNDEPMLPFLTCASHTSPIMAGQTWTGNFQTETLLEVSRELLQNNDIKSWQKMCDHLAKEPHPLTLLPMIALMSRSM